MTISTHAQTSTRPHKLAEFRDHARPLLIFAPDAQDPQLRAQLAILEQHAAEAKDRDLVALALPLQGDVPAGTHLETGRADVLRRRFRIGPAEFAVVLIGKDGGEKLRSAVPFSMEKLISTIDAMPMRQDEMQARPGR